MCCWQWSQPASAFAVCEVSVPAAPGCSRGDVPSGSCSHAGLVTQQRETPGESSPPNTGQESAKGSRAAFCSLGCRRVPPVLLSPPAPSTVLRRPRRSSGIGNGSAAAPRLGFGGICSLALLLSSPASSLNEISGLEDKKSTPDLQPCVLHRQMPMPAPDFNSFLHCHT